MEKPFYSDSEGESGPTESADSGNYGDEAGWTIGVGDTEKIYIIVLQQLQRMLQYAFNSDFWLVWYGMTRISQQCYKNCLTHCAELKKESLFWFDDVQHIVTVNAC